MCSFLDLHIDPEPRWKGLLETNAYAKANDSGKGTMSYGGRDQNCDNAYFFSVSQRSNVDIREVDNREGA